MERLRRQTKTAEASERPVVAYADEVAAAVKLGIRSSYGPTSSEYTTMGFPPPKARKTSVKTKAGAIDKNKATREARGTKGPKQRKADQGRAAVVDDAQQALS